jgi:lipoate-protein ligase A
MRLLRGRGTDPDADLRVTRKLVDQTVDSGERALRVWQPHRVVAFGRRDTTSAGYERARSVAREHGYATVERAVGGRAVAFTGATVAFVRTTPVTDERTGIQDRYEKAIAALASALDDLGVETTRGEPEGAFCPGTHSLSAEGKIAGLAQRVRQSVAVVSGLVVVTDHEQLADVLAPVYDALGIAFERSAVGSLARAGGERTPVTVVQTIERALATGETTVDRVRET